MSSEGIVQRRKPVTETPNQREFNRVERFGDQGLVGAAISYGVQLGSLRPDTAASGPGGQQWMEYTLPYENGAMHLVVDGEY